jgi:hypothetical protein
MIYKVFKIKELNGGKPIVEELVDKADIFKNKKEQLESLGFRFDNNKYKLHYIKNPIKEDIVIVNFTDEKINIKAKKEINKHYLFIGNTKLSIDTDFLIILNKQKENKIQVIWKEENSDTYTTGFINYRYGDIKISFDFDMNFDLVSNPQGKLILQKNTIQVFLLSNNDDKYIFINYNGSYIKSMVVNYRLYNDGDISIRTLNGFRIYLPKNKREGYFNSMKLYKPIKN